MRALRGKRAVLEKKELFHHQRQIVPATAVLMDGSKPQLIQQLQHVRVGRHVVLGSTCEQLAANRLIVSATAAMQENIKRRIHLLALRVRFAQQAQAL